jgi:ribosomal protein S18 acetylase RimI-like enzyme
MNVVLGDRAIYSRLASTTTRTGLRSCWVCEKSGIVVGHAISFDDAAAAAESTTQSVEFPVVLQPFRTLRVPGTWYLSSLAVEPEFRRQRVGSALLAHTARRAIASGITSVSLHVFESKQPAIRLYERAGFSVWGQAPVPPHRLITAGGDILLMVAPATEILARLQAAEGAA